MKKLMTVLAILGLALSIGTGAAVSAAGDTADWDDQPDIYLPVRFN